MVHGLDPMHLPLETSTPVTIVTLTFYEVDKNNYMWTTLSILHLIVREHV